MFDKWAIVDTEMPVGGKEELLCRNVKRFRGGLLFKAHRLVYHSTLVWRVTKKQEGPQIRVE